MSAVPLSLEETNFKPKILLSELFLLPPTYSHNSFLPQFFSYVYECYSKGKFTFLLHNTFYSSYFYIILMVLITRLHTNKKSFASLYFYI